MKNIAIPLASALLALSASPLLVRASEAPAAWQQKAEPQSKIFSGTILKNGDAYVLSDAGTKTSYVLDDAKQASQYEGKKVKVTGTMDAANNIIHVETIQEIA